MRAPPTGIGEEEICPSLVVRNKIMRSQQDIIIVSIVPMQHDEYLYSIKSMMFFFCVPFSVLKQFWADVVQRKWVINICCEAFW